MWLLDRFDLLPQVRPSVRQAISNGFPRASTLSFALRLNIWEFRVNTSDSQVTYYVIIAGALARLLPLALASLCPKSHDTHWPNATYATRTPTRNQHQPRWYLLLCPPGHRRTIYYWGCGEKRGRTLRDSHWPFAMLHDCDNLIRS